ncbi:hypothetical protein ACS0TY_021892 [Phlomoides rotata]
MYIMADSRGKEVISDDDDADDLVIGIKNLDVTLTDINLCLVGRFLTDQQYNFNILKSRMAVAWRPRKGVTIKSIGNGRLLCQFFHPLDLKRIMDGSPWSFGVHPLVLHQLRFGETPNLVPLDKILFWVQIHDLPMGAYTEGVGILLGNYIGRFVEYDSSNKGAVWRPYMRIQVEVSVNNPLKIGRRIKIANGATDMVSFKYEHLNLFCFLCGKLGHTESYCELSLDENECSKPHKWGSWLKAGDRRTTQIFGDKWLRDDGGDSTPTDCGAAGGTEYGSGGTEKAVNDIHIQGNLASGGQLIVRDKDTNITAQGELRSQGAHQHIVTYFNPVFEQQSALNEDDSDIYMLDDPRKRKRLNSEDSVIQLS